MCVCRMLHVWLVICFDLLTWAQVAPRDRKVYIKLSELLVEIISQVSRKENKRSRGNEIEVGFD